MRPLCTPMVVSFPLLTNGDMGPARPWGVTWETGRGRTARVGPGRDGPRGRGPPPQVGQAVQPGAFQRRPQNSVRLHRQTVAGMSRGTPTHRSHAGHSQVTQVTYRLSRTRTHLSPVPEKSNQSNRTWIMSCDHPPALLPPPPRLECPRRRGT